MSHLQPPAKNSATDEAPADRPVWFGASQQNSFMPQHISGTHFPVKVTSPSKGAFQRISPIGCPYQFCLQTGSRSTMLLQQHGDASCREQAVVFLPKNVLHEVNNADATCIVSLSAARLARRAAVRVASTKLRSKLAWEAGRWRKLGMVPFLINVCSRVSFAQCILSLSETAMVRKGTVRSLR